MFANELRRIFMCTKDFNGTNRMNPGQTQRLRLDQAEFYSRLKSLAQICLSAANCSRSAQLMQSDVD